MRRTFQVTMPAGASAGAHAMVAAAVASWQSGDQLKELRDSGQAPGEPRELYIQARRAEGAAASMLTALRALRQTDPGVQIRVHDCGHGLDGTPCEITEVYG